jgi:hypothetical protein
LDHLVEQPALVAVVEVGRSSWTDWCRVYLEHPKEQVLLEKQCMDFVVVVVHHTMVELGVDLVVEEGSEPELVVVWSVTVENWMESWKQQMLLQEPPDLKLSWYARKEMEAV